MASLQSPKSTSLPGQSPDDARESTSFTVFDGAEFGASFALRLLLGLAGTAAALLLRPDLILIWGGMALGILLTLLVQVPVRGRWPRRGAEIFYVIGDLGVICLALYGFGALGSPIGIFLLAAILANGLQFGVWAALLTWVLASLGFLSVLAIEVSGGVAIRPLSHGLPLISTDPNAFAVAVLTGLTVTVFWVALFLLRIQRQNTLSQQLHHSERQAHERALDLEKQLATANRLDALGRLAGGVAHDFNNLLTLIIGYVRHAQRSIETTHPARVDLDEVGLAVQRASSLTRHLLAFSRRQKGEPRPIDVCETLTRMKSLFRRVLGENIAIELQLPQAQIVINADPGQLEQVLLHLVVNARDAMLQGGQLLLACDAVKMHPPLPDGAPVQRPGDYARITVADTGVGMSAETVQRIFEPFFTSKKRSHAAGLGLAAVHGIVSAGGGDLKVESQLGEGSRFTIFLPLVKTDWKHTLTPVDGVVMPRLVGRERLLLVEDEAKLAAMLQGLLSQHGYQVTTAASAEQALEKIDQGFIPELLLTDVVLTGEPGTELARKLRQKCTALKILFISGHGGEVLARYPLEGAEMLAKPFTDRQLLAHVRQVLDKDAGGRP